MKPKHTDHIPTFDEIGHYHRVAYHIVLRAEQALKDHNRRPKLDLVATAAIKQGIQRPPSPDLLAKFPAEALCENLPYNVTGLSIQDILSTDEPTLINRIVSPQYRQNIRATINTTKNAAQAFAKRMSTTERLRMEPHNPHATKIVLTAYRERIAAYLRPCLERCSQRTFDNHTSLKSAEAILNRHPERPLQEYEQRACALHVQLLVDARNDNTYTTDIRRLNKLTQLLNNAGTNEAWHHYQTHLEFRTNVKETLSKHMPTLMRYVDFDTTNNVSQPEMRIPPDLSELLKEIAAFEQLAARVQAARNSLPNDTKPKIKAAAKRLRTRKANQRLFSMPIDDLRNVTPGLRTGPLKNAGCDTVGKLIHNIDKDLSAIHGISAQGADRIQEATKTLIRNVYDDTICRPYDDLTDPAAMDLLRNTRTRMMTTELLQDAKELLNETYDELIRRKKNLLSIIARLTPSDIGRLTEATHDLRRAINRAHNEGLKERMSEFIEATDHTFDIDDNALRADALDRKSPYLEELRKVASDILDTSDYYGLPEEIAKEVEQQPFFPDGLKCELRRYQEWGTKYILHQERTLLGDEMGLGKTIQSIAAMVSLINTGEQHFVVIAPASVAENWTREIQERSGLIPRPAYGSPRQRKSEFREWELGGGVLITTYDIAKRLGIEKTEMPIGLITVDEAHMIKNPDAARTITCTALIKKARRATLMTGTPIENDVKEMTHLIALLDEQVAIHAAAVTDITRSTRFMQVVAPVYYRRRLKDVLTELPKRNTQNVWLEMHAREREIYENDLVKTKSFMHARRLSWDVPAETRSCKAERMAELVIESIEAGRRVLVFSNFRDTLERAAQTLQTTPDFKGKIFGPVNGSVPSPERQRIVDEFSNTDPHMGAVLIGQITAMGVGLNIQAAQTVIICEPQVKPAMEDQAIGRAHRMGQTRTVFVYRLLCKTSVDDRMQDILKDKRHQFNAFADDSVARQNIDDIDDGMQKRIIEDEIERIVTERKKSKIETDTDDGIADE